MRTGLTKLLSCAWPLSPDERLCRYSISNILTSQVTSKALKSVQIRERLIQIELDGAAKRAIGRLSRNDHAIEALAELMPTGGQLEGIIGSLVEADNIGRSLGKRLDKEKAMRRLIKKLDRAVDDLAAFVKAISAEKQDLVNAFVNVRSEERRVYNQAFYELRLLLKARDRIAVQTPIRLGATRKRNMKNASLNAGMGWLAASIKAGSPHVRQACILSETLFGIREVSEYELRRAMRETSQTKIGANRQFIGPFGESARTGRTDSGA